MAVEKRNKTDRRKRDCEKERRRKRCGNGGTKVRQKITSPVGQVAVPTRRRPICCNVRGFVLLYYPVFSDVVWILPQKRTAMFLNFGP